MRRGEAPEGGIARFEQFLDEWSRRDFMRRMGGATAFALFTAGGMGLLEACANAGQQAEPKLTPKKGGKLVTVDTADIQTMNPVLSADSQSSYVVTRLFDGLLTSDPKGNPVGVLASSWKVSSDNLTYTFNLRKEAVFSDGHPLTSEDVLFTYNLMFAPEYKKVNSPRRADLEEFVQSMSAPEPQTFVVKLKKVYAPFLVAQSGYGILPKHVVGNLSPEQINTADYNSAPTVTSGAFKFVEWKKGDRVVMARNEKYYRGAPNLDNWVFRLVGNRTEVLNALKTGEADVGTIQASDVDNAKTVDRITVIPHTALSFVFFQYQLDPSKPASKFFSDKAVRQALFYAIDREQIIDSVLFKQAKVANSVIPPDSWAYNADTKPVYKYDKKKAADMLDAAGWRLNSSTGIREKNGVPFKFEWLVNSGSKVVENYSQAIQQMWKEIGVVMNPNFADFNKVVVKALKDTRNFDVLLVGFSWSLDPDESDVWHSRNTAPGHFNAMGYKNPEVDKLLDDAVGTVDKNKRKDLYVKLQNLLAEEVPAPVLWYNITNTGLNKRVGNYAEFLKSPFVGARYFIKDIFVADGK